MVICHKCKLYKSIKGRRVCTKCRTLYHKEWQSKNANSYSNYHREYQTKRAAKDPAYKISRQLRKRLNAAIDCNQKAGSAIENLGCSIQELKTHLESKFQDGMSWTNYGEWHIDHIIPLSKFDLSNMGDLKKACHYTNLQPLWAIDNFIKHNKS